MSALSRPNVLLFDAGNTLVFLDHDALAEAGERAFVQVAGSALRDAEPTAKRLYEAELTKGLSHEDGWHLYVRTLFTVAGIGEDDAARATIAAWEAHDRLNLWRKVPTDLRAALARGRASGMRYGVVSNSEGKLAGLLAHVGLDGWFEHVVDSALEGVRKPDPEIFRRALARMGASPEETMYAGDIPHVDVEGARAAGIAGVLIDTLGHYPAYRDAPRFVSVFALMEALCP